MTSKSPTMVRIGMDGLLTSPYSGANSFSRDSLSIFFANKQSSCCGLMKSTRIVLNIWSCGCCGSLFNTISRILTEFNQYRWIKQHFIKRKLITIRVLIRVNYFMDNQITSGFHFHLQFCNSSLHVSQINCPIIHTSSLGLLWVKGIFANSSPKTISRMFLNFWVRVSW